MNQELTINQQQRVATATLVSSIGLFVSVFWWVAGFWPGVTNLSATDKSAPSSQPWEHCLGSDSGGQGECSYAGCYILGKERSLSIA